MVKGLTLVILLVMVSGLLLAKSNDAIEACSKSQAVVAVVAISQDDFISDYGDLYALILAGEWSEGDSDEEALRSVVDMRQRYYADIQPAMPDCAGSLRAQLSFSDAFSEAVLILGAVNLINLPGDEYDYFSDTVEDMGLRFAQSNKDLIAALQELQEESGI